MCGPVRGRDGTWVYCGAHLKDGGAGADPDTRVTQSESPPAGLLIRLDTNTMEAVDESDDISALLSSVFYVYLTCCWHGVCPVSEPSRADVSGMEWQDCSLLFEISHSHGC